MHGMNNKMEQVRHTDCAQRARQMYLTEMDTGPGHSVTAQIFFLVMYERCVCCAAWLHLSLCMANGCHFPCAYASIMNAGAIPWGPWDGTIYPMLCLISLSRSSSFPCLPATPFPFLRFVYLQLVGQFVYFITPTCALACVPGKEWPGWLAGSLF